MNNISAAEILNRVWNYAHVLRDEGVGYGDYVEQLTYLIFLKMSSERAESGQGGESLAADRWAKLIELDGSDLEVEYRHTLESLGSQKGTLGMIFRKAQNKIQDPEKLERLISMINKESWSSLSIDVKGEIYEGLLQKGAESEKKGAGQYFTPRPIIEAIVDVMQPQPMQTIADPACGTGGFLTAAHDYVVFDIDRVTGKRTPKSLSKKENRFLKNEAISGNDISDSVARLCAMNLYLHGIGTEECPISTSDALAKEVGLNKVDMVLANPPFGKKSSITIINDSTGKLEKEKLTYTRADFWAETSNKQLNFVQHIGNMLKVDGSNSGKAAVVLPDNVLFEGGAGETIRKALLARFKLHTILRLPTGIFYAQGVKANVIFFDAKPAAKEPWTESVWVYDYRTNVHKTLRTNKLVRSDFDEFVELYKPGNLKARVATWAEVKNEETGAGPNGRWREYRYDEIIARDKTNLDITWLKDQSLEDIENLQPPAVIASEIVELLTAALEEFKSVEEALVEEDED
ncbi:UNVERIFIED_ORG: type I restriction enzyme M protein [Kosakonia oryzae]|uniref:site-specific DNA-methyltransferase (adenine-specific) n=1 Tax=Kosakonia radicincitans TaxID=283686 RepID=A0AAX2ELT3_9ENTR|nr:class I SAM-dependent DNA methyltransferase [Kosakonia radicincitans]MDP9565003.1 type I restriction enzyme M protein [Kosakonia oryzae]SFD91728.1 type I restriction enzyme M protein [Kosakonia radicincitans]SFQ97294.1 type I restriction enzyme M protein [Kosakonia radicincitans]SFT39710.1 type I restriction enzyme M protein [Kosakonia radicincitans]SFX08907.1 type I restriction enzyme M protein [Kosakonia radicincitans]